MSDPNFIAYEWKNGKLADHGYRLTNPDCQ